VAGLVTDRGFWKGRRVFLTGHTGFKGGWLSLWLQDMGAQVFGYALPPDSGLNFFEAADVSRGMTHTVGDLRSLYDLCSAMQFARPEIVFHLGAQSLVRESYVDPVGTFATNVMGTVHLIEAARRLNLSCPGDPPLRAVLIVTSDKSYRNNEWIWPYRESEPLGGHDPYSSSKACAELVTAAYRSSLIETETPTMKIASARAGNVIGGGDWAKDRIVPDAVQAFAQDRPLMLRNPHAIRPWQHVLEPLAGYLMLAEQLYCGSENVAEAWNFGPDASSEQSVSHLVSLIAECWGGDARWNFSTDSHPHEARLLRLDSSKARFELGWRPRLSLERAVKMTVDWYRLDLKQQAAVREFTVSQIRAYAASKD
jgi:CDP-glucose 4,6-dehydratase